MLKQRVSGIIGLILRKVLAELHRYLPGWKQCSQLVGTVPPSDAHEEDEAVGPPKMRIPKCSREPLHKLIDWCTKELVEWRMRRCGDGWATDVRIDGVE